MYSSSRARYKRSSILRAVIVGITALSSLVTASIVYAADFEWYMGRRDFSKKQGTIASSGISIDRYGWSGPVSFSYIGLPPGITATVNANPMTARTGIATMVVSPTTPIGSYHFILRASAEGTVRDQPIDFVVTRGTTVGGTTSGTSTGGTSSGGTSTGGTSTAGGGTAGSTTTGGSSTGGSSTTGGSTGGTPVVSTFTLSSSPTASIQQGQSASLPISINRTNFTSAVALSLSGAPIGVTASFSPSSTTSNSVMTLNVSGGVSPATYNMTVSASSMGILQTAPIVLTVTEQPANFTMTAPSSLTIRQGQSSSLGISLSRTNMTESVAFTVSGLPLGVTGSCPATTNNSSICSFTASSSATTGVATLNIEATGGLATRAVSVTMNVTSSVPVSGGLKAFPEAEGFGAVSTSGGRGGVVCKVTNTNRTGPGSFQECMDIQGPAYIVFTTSGVIQHGSMECHYGNKTIAGQTSPAGIIVRGFELDNVYENNPGCQNLIIRHLRSRPAAGELSSTGWISADGTRLDGVRNIVMDHMSFERASDEAIQLSRSNNITIQNSILGETFSEHFWGGLLINYSTTLANLDNLSIHHNLWSRIRGRFPEISCEENADGGSRLGSSNCTNKRLKIEVANNMIWDPIDPVWYNPCTGLNEGDMCASSAPRFFLDMNWVGNYMMARSSFDNPMIVPTIVNESRNDVYYRDNYLDTGAAQLFNLAVPTIGGAFEFPDITETLALDLPDHVGVNVGAFPRDPMDQRIIGYLGQDVDNTPLYYNPNNDHGAIPAASYIPDTFRTLTPSCEPLLNIANDTDNDGMPDAWERRNGLVVGVADHNGTDLSSEGYPNIEIFLNDLSNSVVQGGSSTNSVCQYLN